MEGTKFFKTDHYKRYPYVLIKVEDLIEPRARQLIDASFEIAQSPLPLR
jgi:hypothetical protein